MTGFRWSPRQQRHRELRLGGSVKRRPVAGRDANSSAALDASLAVDPLHDTGSDQTEATPTSGEHDGSGIFGDDRESALGVDEVEQSTADAKPFPVSLERVHGSRLGGGRRNGGTGPLDSTEHGAGSDPQSPSKAGNDSRRGRGDLPTAKPEEMPGGDFRLGGDVPDAHLAGEQDVGE